MSLRRKLTSPARPVFGAKRRIAFQRGQVDRSELASSLLNDIHAHDVVTLADQGGVALRRWTSLHATAHAQARRGIHRAASFYFYNTKAEVDRLWKW